MSKKTDSSDGRALDSAGLPSRRAALLGFLTAAPVAALSSLATASAAPPMVALAALPGASTDLSGADHRVVDLWEQRALLRPKMRRLVRVRDQALARMPWWAREGYSYVDAGGTLCGEISNAPADPETTPPDRHRMLIRMTPGWAKMNYSRNVTWSGEERCKKNLDDQLAEIARHIKLLRAEEARCGVSNADGALDLVRTRVREIEDEIEALSPTTPHVASAKLMIEVEGNAHGDDTQETSTSLFLVGIALSALSDSLTGRLKRDALELVMNPRKHIRNLGLSVFLCSVPAKWEPPTTLFEARGDSGGSPVAT